MSPEEKAAALAAMSPEERAAALAAMSPEEKAAALAAMSPEEKAAALAAMSPEEQAAALAAMSPEEKAAALAAMSPEEQAAALAAMSPEEQAAALAAMSPEEKAAALAAMSEATDKAAAIDRYDSELRALRRQLEDAAVADAAAQQQIEALKKQISTPPTPERKTFHVQAQPLELAPPAKQPSQERWFTSYRVRQLRKVFLCFDYNEDRLVEELEMLLVGRALHRGCGGWSAEQNEAKFAVFDHDGDGCIDFDEFLEFYAECFSPKMSDEEFDQGVEILLKAGKEGREAFNKLNPTSRQQAKLQIRKMDKDSDGKISQAEYLAAGGTVADFQKYDKDGSGTLDTDELEAKSVGQILVEAKIKFQSLDEDDNGVLEGEELIHLAEWAWTHFRPSGEELSAELKVKHGTKLLKRLDTNGDGLMDFEEFEGWFRRTCGAIERDHKKQAKLQMTQMDKDGDGKISQAEYLAAGGTVADFQKYDEDGSGTLDKDELEVKSKEAVSPRPSGTKYKKHVTIPKFCGNKACTCADPNQERAVKLRNLFSTFDFDNNGFIQRDEMNIVSLCLKDETVDFKAYDADGDDFVSFAEFAEFYQGLKMDDHQFNATITMLLQAAQDGRNAYLNALNHQDAST